MKTIYYYFQNIHDVNDIIVAKGSFNPENRLVSVGRITCPNGLVEFMAAFEGLRVLGTVQL